MTHESDSSLREDASGRCRGVLSLGCWCGVLAIIWLVVLPWWADRATMQSHLEWLHVRQIDPSAMYYTELEAMKPILQKHNARLTGRTALHGVSDGGAGACDSASDGINHRTD